MRWDQQLIETEGAHELPGYRDPATVRTFDAPEALDTRFYEVRSKSALNRVPKASRMPFRWTINPYRGCAHACVYCLSGETPVLMGDGRWQRIADVRAGDQIYGTIREGAYRRYATTEVRDQWSSIKPAFRVTLTDGTELVASGDHRFLTRRGWKHVTGAMGGPDQRPYLTGNDQLLGMGSPARAPEDWPDYRRGYLTGLIRGDGHLGSYQYSRGGGVGTVHRFRLALSDFDALDRAQGFLEDELGVRTRAARFASPGRPMRMIRTSAAANVAAITGLIAWPDRPRPEWCKGFLAGIFDAEGSHGQVIRIHNSDPEIVGWTAASLDTLGFAYVIEDQRPVQVVRLTGGLPARMRFFSMTDPAISRKRSIEGLAVKTQVNLGVEAIEPLGSGHRLYDLTTGTGDFVANGVISHNCFARPTHTYLDMDAGRDFEKEIVVKVNVPEVLRAELRRPSWKREHVALGTNTDPYQWVEGRYRLMPDIWDALAESGTPGSVLTKSPLLLRDLEHMLRVPRFTANLSVPTLDEKAWRASEPHTPNPRARLEAVAELNRAGIPCGVLIAPLMPGINDSPEQVEKILELAGEAGAVSAGGIALHLRGEVREVFFEWLRSYRPDLVERYEKLYARGAYAPRRERERIAALTRGGGRRFMRPEMAPPPEEEPAPPPPPLQEVLF